jgi:hypothetical protein
MNPNCVSVLTGKKHPSSCDLKSTNDWTQVLQITILCFIDDLSNGLSTMISQQKIVRQTVVMFLSFPLTAEL